ncbi:MAG: hypothetical protein DHS80DRAFT_879, partial [Piptocephalis tieghemiana]
QARLPAEEQKPLILKQVEFYFGDSNYVQDKFLQREAAEDHGWVSIEKIASFKRMRQFGPLEVVVDALRASPELLEVNAEGTHVRRRTPVVENSDYFHRSIYAKGFPIGESKEEEMAIQEKLEAYFKPMGDVRSVRMRRNFQTKRFKGSVFVELGSREEAVALADKPLQYEGKDLLVMTKEGYFLKKGHEKCIEPGS